MIPHLTIVGDVRVTQEQVMTTDACRNFLMGATVDRCILTKHIASAYNQMCGLSHVFQILRFATNRREREKLVVRPNAARTFDHHVRVQHTRIAQHHMIPDHTTGTNRYVIADLGLRGNDSGRMNHGSQCC